VGNALCGINNLKVQEINKKPMELTKAPQPPDYVIGIHNIRAGSSPSPSPTASQTHRAACFPSFPITSDHFKKFYLLQPFTSPGKFDIILCRNVAIYFNMEDKKNLFNRPAQSPEPDGYPIIGSTESLMGIRPRFMPKRHLNSKFYQLK